MHRSPAARRAAHLFGSVLGGSLLLLSGGMLMAKISSRTEAPATVLETCLAMMQQLWGILPHHDVPSPFALLLVVLMLASGTWAGGGWRRGLAPGGCWRIHSVIGLDAGRHWMVTVQVML